MGETEDKNQERAIEMALMGQKITSLESWKREHEQQQEAKMERLENATNNSIANLEHKLDKFVESIGAKIDSIIDSLNEEKSNWINRIPWWITLLFGSLVSTIVYLLTRK